MSNAGTTKKVQGTPFRVSGEKAGVGSQARGQGQDTEETT